MIYNNDNSKAICDKFNLNLASKMPIDVEVYNLCDNGLIEDYDGSYLSEVVRSL